MFRKGHSFSYTEVEDDYTAVDTDTFIGVDSSSNTVKVTLPDALLKPAGRHITVFDVAGDAGTNSITIEDESETELVELDANDTGATVVSTGAAWVVINQIGLVGPTGPTGPAG